VPSATADVAPAISAELNFLKTNFVSVFVGIQEEARNKLIFIIHRLGRLVCPCWHSGQICAPHTKIQKLWMDFYEICY
jgi:hypothetical protein